MGSVMKILRSLAIGWLGLASAAGAQSWKVQTSGMDTSLRGVSAAMRSGNGKEPVVWASGSKGVVLLSTDEGTSWRRIHVDGGETLDFRGVHAFDEKTAYLMSSGEGEKSRIYKTTDGGESWKLQYTEKRKEFFLDAIVCESEVKCFALGDPMDGKFVILGTRDGTHWSRLPTDEMPPALTGEGAFAA